MTSVGVAGKLAKVARRFGVDLRRVNAKTSPFLRLVQELERRRIRTVLDVGANDGGFASDLIEAGFRGRVISFEPLPDAWASLRERALRQPRIWEVGPRVALSDKAGTAVFHQAANSVSSSLLAMAKLHEEAAPGSAVERKIEVQTRTLDELLDPLSINAGESVLLKIDVQGAERLVLAGAKKALEDQVVGVKLEMSMQPLYEGQPLWLELPRSSREWASIYGIWTLASATAAPGSSSSSTGCISVTHEPSHPPTQTRYRADIDGLRALAVAPIVLFHARVPGFSGGYVGVDIFYVISGFLITSIIDPQIMGRRFSVAGFYNRRIRRIFPAFFAMLAVVCVLGAIILTPPDLRAMGKSVMGAAVFAPNVIFYSEAGYFNAASELKPLLHTWSLGVEEQFYLFFPLTLWLLRGLGRKGAVAAVGVIAVASFALGVWTTERSPVFAFFMIPARAWELLLGALIALGAFPALTNRAACEALALVGLAMTFWAIFTFNDHTAFPGIAGLLPVVGSALMIYAGQGTLVGRGLAFEPFRQLGLISYSLYLWH